MFCWTSWTHAIQWRVGHAVVVVGDPVIVGADVVVLAWTGHCVAASETTGKYRNNSCKAIVGVQCCDYVSLLKSRLSLVLLPRNVSEGILVHFSISNGVFKSTTNLIFTVIL
ncbi:hypothetical protein PoB_005059000 [Plakobranchus ocellatus]|uniref:Secreted protein n=1 Tax=Plakobranchus ocellatus TaxID=259542 RepID=A0AAV4BUG3_9GAST|nr:hypothetical protein PoB_005059000 [Plakobranchus ocellatus]